VLNYNHLYYFHVAAAEGSLVAAAARLGIAQPTISEQIRALERALGLVLFERRSGGLKLTDGGRLVYDHTTVMFRAAERLAEALGHDVSDVPRTLRIGFSAAAARSTTTTFLMPLLALEDCVPVIRSGDSVELLRDLRAAELDLVLCESEPPEAARRDLDMVLIERTMLVAVAAPELTLSPDWANISLVQYRSSSALRWDIETYLDQQGLRPRITAEADDAAFLVEAAARGGCVAFVPRSVARDAVTAGRLRVLATLSPEHAGVYALYPQSSTAELARRAIEVLMEHVRQVDTVTA